MEIILFILGLLLAFALATNENKKNSKRNGFDADDEFDL